LKYSVEKTEETLDKIKQLGFEYSSLAGFSWGMDDLVIPPEKKKIIELAEKEVGEVGEYFKKGLLTVEEKTNRIIEVWTKAKSEVEKLVPKALPPEGPVFSFIDAGAKGSWSQPVQMAGMKGLVISPTGETIQLPVKSSFKEGFDILEYFISTHGARKGTVDTALRTSTAGYLTRRLVDVAHDVVVFEEDCKDDQGIEMLQKEAEAIGQNFLSKIVGRVSLENIRSQTDKGKIIVKVGEIIDWQKGEQIAKGGIEKVRVRSPLSCKAMRGVCQKCYGWDLGRNKLMKLGEAAGIVAAQAIGEPGTQLTMRTFHTGGVAGGGDITLGLPRVQEVFEAREPRGKAVMSQVDGKILEINAERIIKIKAKLEDSKEPHTIASSELRGKNDGRKAGKKEKKTEIIEYPIPSQMAIWVEAGQDVKKGQQLCEGNLDLRELFRLVGKEETQHYIVKEIQKIYASQGATIHDKHVEVIVRQMFSRLRIKEPGDSSFTPGEIASRETYLEENALLKKQNKAQAKGVPVLLGISQVALTTDSFLSAASFQETSRILIRAAIEGKEDKLRGLKENVIIGKLIPVGTGFKK
jgi:DNA-directed RNA polymerase subunit beta'